MDLKEFIKKSIVEIVEGIQDAQLECGPAARINPKGLSKRVTPNELFWDEASGLFAESVEFDLAVTVTESNTVDSKGAISVLGTGAGVDGHQAASESRVSRIRFRTLIIFPSAEPTPPKKERKSLRQLRDEAQAKR